MKINYSDEGRGAPVILIHAWGETNESMAVLGQYLVDAGYRVVNIDLPGFGLSEDPIKPLEMNDYIEIIVDLVHQLQFTRPVLIGHAFGAKLAMFCVAKYPKRFARLILINPVGVYIKKGRSKRVFDMIRSFGEVLFWIPPFLLIRPLVEWIYYQLFVNRAKYERGKVVQQSYQRVATEFINQYLYRIKIPTLTICGEYDQSICPNVESARHETIAGGGSNLPVTHPQTIASLLFNFLD